MKRTPIKGRGATDNFAHVYEGVKAGDIARRFSCSWPTITRHLKQLEEAGLVHAERDGRERMYRLDRDRLLGATSLWLSHFED